MSAGGPPRCLIVVVSDRRAAGTAQDTASPALERALKAVLGDCEVSIRTVPDERDQISSALVEWVRTDGALVLTSGGTGLGPRDVTPEATRDVIDRPAPGLVHALLAAGLRSTPHAMLSRPEAGTAGRTLIVNLPGSPKGALESLEAIAPAIPHALSVLRDPDGGEAGHQSSAGLGSAHD